MDAAENMAQEIERLRQQLEALIGLGVPMDSREVADLSRRLDDLVVRYTRLQREGVKVIE
ncbi:MAG: Spo0E family sporulation regulatory protein-aspartic acid phosphatase [Thermoanaerobacteraceae bacterium]|nr:Spo0E family sporulation regulatory protein-aspartic acid phosphatase [Thermoanaerobacteraceae bacterium]